MSRVAASVQKLNPAATVPLSLEESRAHFQQTISDSLTNSLIGRWWGAIGRGVGWLTRRKGGVPFVAAVIYLNFFALALGIILTAWLGEFALVHPAHIIALVGWSGYTVLYVLVLHTQLNFAVQRLSMAIAESISNATDLVSVCHFLQNGTRLAGHLLFCILFALFWIPYLTLDSSQGEILLGTLTLYSFNYFQMGMYLYFLIVLILFILALSRYELDIYANDPSNSPVVWYIYQAANGLILSVAAIEAVHYLLIIALNFDISAPVSLATLIALGWLPPIVAFAVIHFSLARIMTGAKGRKLAQVQRLIAEVERNGDLTNKEEFDKVQRLMDYHDRIKTTPNSMINLSSITNLLGSLLLPLIATFLGNLDTILAFFR